MIHKNYTLEEVLAVNPNFGFVLHRFGIELDVSSRSIEEACGRVGVDADFFIDILNVYQDESSFNREKFLDYDIEVIIDYLKKTHSFYLTKRLLEIEMSIANLKKSYSSEYALFDYLEAFFVKYKSELVLHIGEEERKLFPYIKSLFGTAQSEKDIIQLVDRMKYMTVEEFIQKHDDHIELELSDLRTALKEKYSSLMNVSEFRVFFTQLETFEKDLHIHALIEDAVLIPKSLKLEKEIKSRVAS